MEQKMLSLLGIARRSGRVSLGADAAKEALAKHRSRLLLLAADVSERSEKAMKTAADGTGVPVLRTMVPMDRLGAAVGKPGTGILSVNDIGFAEKIQTLLVNGQEECL